MVSNYDVFLAYSRTDAQIPATAIARQLEANGLRVWSDASLAPGEPISDALEQAMAESRVIIILLSPVAAKGPWLRREVAYALRRQISVIPVVLDRTALDSPLGSLLGDRAFVDVSGMPADAAAREVLTALNKYALVVPPRDHFHEVREAAPLTAAVPRMSSRILRFGFYVSAVAILLLLITLLTRRDYREFSPAPDYEFARQQLAMRLREGEVIHNLRGVDLARMDLASIHFEGVNLTDANLSAADLSRAFMVASRFDGAWLTKARMRGVVARSASFVGASLLAADLRNADLHNANLSHADMRIADLRGTMLSGAKLEDTDLEGAVFDKSTQWPQDFDAQKMGASCRDCSADHEH